VFTKVLHLQNCGQVQTLPVFVSSEDDCYLTAPAEPSGSLHLALHNPCEKNQRIHRLVREKVEGMARSEKPKTKDITKIKWCFSQLGIDAILLRD